MNQAPLFVRFLQVALFPLSLSLGVGGMALSLHLGLGGESMALIITLAAIMVVVVAERYLPVQEAWNRNQADLRGDVLSLATIVVVLQPLLRLIAPILVIGILHAVGRPDGLGWFPNHWPLWMQLPLLALGVEFGKYWMHRLGHEHPWWWRFHAVHHSPRRVYWLNGFLIHPFNFLYAYGAGIFLMLLSGAGQEVLLLHAVFEGIGAAFQHANVRLKHGWLSRIFSTNELHFWHHSTKLREANTNYGAVLIVWDWVFGTYFRPDDRTSLPQELGVADPVSYPIGQFGLQVVAPFCWGRCILQRGA